MRVGLLRLAAIAGVAVGLGLAPKTSVWAQTQATSVVAAGLPANVLAGLIAGTPDGIEGLRSYLATEGGSSEGITSRAVQVVQQLKSSGLTSDPALIVAAANRVAQTVSDSLNSARVMQLRVDRTFQPPQGAIALDFGPADKPRTEGFQRVQPDDPIIKGDALRGLRRAGQQDQDDALLSGGIAGVEELNIDLPDGEYRVILMTEALGETGQTLAPFGQQIVANGEPLDIFNTSPGDWLRQAVLSRQGLDGLNNADSHYGGAVTLTVRVVGGKLQMNFRMPGAEGLLRTYLTGMIIQPIEQPSLLARTPDADRSRASVDQRLQSEAQVASAIGDLLQQVAPAAGNNGNLNNVSNNNRNNTVNPRDLPEPVVEPRVVASPS